MVELDDIPRVARDRLEQLGATDLVIGILASGHDGKMNGVLPAANAAVGRLNLPVRAVVIQPETSPAQEALNGLDAGNGDMLPVVPYPLFPQQSPADPLRKISDAYRALFAVCDQLGARACVAIVSDPETVTAAWINSLIQPVLELGFDLVTPCYSHHKFEGLLNRAIISPLTCALYAKRIQHPLGPDFGFSGRLLQRVLGTAARARSYGPGLPPMSIATEALNGMEVCQAHVGMRTYPPADWTNMSSVVTQVLHPFFSEVERNAALWQRVRGSTPVPTFGEAPEPPDEDGAPDVQRLIESYQLGWRSLNEVWRLVMPPTTLLELSKLARVRPDQFRMSDELWVRISYDFALGHRMRVINQEHLLGAMTPLYLAWAASHVLEIEGAQPDAIERRVGQLCVAYETAKPYFLSRWRWPDRFYP